MTGVGLALFLWVFVAPVGVAGAYMTGTEAEDGTMDGDQKLAALALVCGACVAAIWLLK